MDTNDLEYLPAPVTYQLWVENTGVATVTVMQIGAFPSLTIARLAEG